MANGHKIHRNFRFYIIRESTCKYVGNSTVICKRV